MEKPKNRKKSIDSIVCSCFSAINIVILVLQILELFGVGTACVVSPIERINYLGNDLHIPTLEQTNSLYLEFKNTLAEIQYGKVDHPWARAID